MKEKILQYPIGSLYYKVCTNKNDYSGIVMDMNGDKDKFYFTYSREKAKQVTDINLINEGEELLSWMMN